MLLFKKSKSLQLKDDVGCFFKGHNIIEFKGFGDGINLNDFYKIQGYAIMYMTVDRNIKEIPVEDITITVMQYRFPKETFRVLEEKKCKIEERTDGIYEVIGQSLFPIQVIDLKKLGEEWDVFKILVPGATIEQLERIQKPFDSANNNKIKEHLSDVLQISIKNNVDMFTRMNQEGRMSEAVRIVFSKEIDEQTNLFKEEAAVKMIRDKVPVKNISEWLDLPFDIIVEIAMQHGITTLS